MKKKKVEKKVEFSGKYFSLTPVEEEVLKLHSGEFLTAKQIAYRRKTSDKAVYKILARLKKKGVFDGGLNRVEKPRGTCQPNDKIRLHGEEINIKILYKNSHYNRLLKQSNKFYLEGNTIKLYRGSLEIYSGQSFYGKDAQEATSKSLAYWRRFFARLEHELKAVLVKPRSRNIRFVNAHYASTNSEICEKAIEEGSRIKIFAEEDGKLAFITDDSFGFKEDETVHPVTAKPDREAIDKQVNDWRINNPPTISEISVKVMEVTNNQLLFAKNIETHIKAIQDLGTGVQELVSLIKQLKGGD